MKSSQPAGSRAGALENPSCCDEDEIGVLLRQAWAEPHSEAVVGERWNCLAERIVADLQRELLIAQLEVRGLACDASPALSPAWMYRTLRLA